MVDLYEARYQMEMGCGSDSWRLYGVAIGHPQIKDGDIVMTSSPVSFDENGDILTTASGRVYKIVSYLDSRDKTIGQIKEDIKKGGFELH